MLLNNCEYPGYIGYKVIANEALQTGVHCCDIAMHIDRIQENIALKEIVAFLEQPHNIKDEGAAIIDAQKILNSFLQSKRRELCEFAIKKIQDPNEGIIYCELLGPEIKTAILVGTDFSIPESELPSLSDMDALDAFCQKPEICIAYIQQYYLVGNGKNEDPSLAKMFIVPQPGTTGMLNIAAKWLQRNIIVVNARNGEPFITEDYSNISKPPIYIGYDGYLHFVELQPCTIEQLEKETSSTIREGLEQSIYEDIMAATIAQQTKEMHPQQLLIAQQQLFRLKGTYAEIITAKKTIEKRQKTFINLLKNCRTVQETDTLYSVLLAKHTQWLQQVHLSTVDATRVQQIQSQQQCLQELINNNVPNLDTQISKSLINIIWSVSESNIALAAKITAAFDMAQELTDFFVANAYQTPSPQINEAMSAVSWLQQIKSWLSQFVAIIIYPFNACVTAIAGLLFAKPTNDFVVSHQNIVSQQQQANIATYNIRATKNFTPLRDGRKREVVSGMPQQPAVNNPKRCCIIS